MMAELAENEPANRLWPWKKNYQISKACVFPFGFRKWKAGNLLVPSSELHLVFVSIYSILGIEKVLNTCIVDCDSRESRFTTAGQSSAMFAWNWTEASVLDNQFDFCA